MTISSSGSECAEPDQDEQRDRAHQPREQEEDEGRRDLPGRQLGPQAGDGKAEVHGVARVGQEEDLDIPKLEKMDELKGKAKGKKRTGLRTVKSICERILTVPLGSDI